MDPLLLLIPVVGLIVLLLLARTVLGVVRIKEDEVGQVIKKFSLDGKKLPEGRLLALNGEPGYQAHVLTPGIHLGYWAWMYDIVKDKVIRIKPGEIGLVAAKDGGPMPADRILGKAVACNMFQDAEAFLRNGGQKGKQAAVLTAGLYRINRALFDIHTAEVTTIGSDKIGILTTFDGTSMPQGQMAAPIVEGHKNFQDPDAFIERGGSRGLQEQILLAGQYNLNPWFVNVQEADLTSVPIGHVGVVVSFVGEDKADISGENFTHGNIVPKGGKGVWAEPLYPGKHPINTRVMKVEIVPTTNIVLNWANARSEAHQLDDKLSTITVRAKDGFPFNLDVSQIINIGAKDAPYVISRVGSVKNLVAQVLEPIIGNYFRNSAQRYTVLDFLEQRAERQLEARSHITEAVQAYNVQSVDTLIGDITPPAELMRPLTDRKVAQEQRQTYVIQMEAQKTRQALEAETALAEKQKELVNEEQNIVVAERQAQAAIRKADGEAQSAAKRAEGDSLAIQRKAEGEAEAIRRRGMAESEILSLRGRNEAQAIQAVGLAKAEAAKAGVDAMGSHYALLQIVSQLAEHNIKLVPDVNVASGPNGGGVAEAILGLLVQQMTSQSQSKAAGV
jgi:uncharacterized membrane protein YqiK